MYCRRARVIHPSVEQLEPIVIMSAALPESDTLGPGFTLSGFSWPSRSITWSIAPDGTQWDHGVNNINATFDAEMGAGRWEPEIARALSSWGAVAGLTFTEVSDDGEPEAVNGLDQADSRFGDIRIGGYPYSQHDSSVLGQTYYPGSGGTIAGDIEINTNIKFSVGQGVDIFGVMLHETGHALGLAHSTNPDAVMWPVYHPVSGLALDDIAGIQALYPPVQTGAIPVPPVATAPPPPVAPIPLPPIAVPPPTSPQVPVAPTPTDEPVDTAVNPPPASGGQAAGPTAGPIVPLGHWTRRRIHRHWVKVWVPYSQARIARMIHAIDTSYSTVAHSR